MKLHLVLNTVLLVLCADRFAKLTIWKCVLPSRWPVLFILQIPNGTQVTNRPTTDTLTMKGT